MNNFTLTLQQLGAWLLRAAAAAGIVISSNGTVTGVNSKNVATFVMSAAYLIVDRYLADPSTGTPTPPSPTFKPKP